MNTIVSVIIASYNSSKFIIETLNSVYSQTWKDIELIITDDCSSDDTVEICQKWIEENNLRFCRVLLLESQINTGVSANSNRGLRAATGEWVKFLAADDTLLNDCLENNLDWVNKHPEIRVLLSRIAVYKNTFDKENFIHIIPGQPGSNQSIVAEGRSAESQYKMLLTCDRIHFSPSFLIKRETMLTVGGFDERFRLLEDYPLWLNLTKKGFRLYFMDKLTVNYRMHSKALNNRGESLIVNPNYFQHESFRRIYTYPFLPKDLLMNARYIWMISQPFRIKALNKKNTLNRFINSLLTVYINPFIYFLWIKKRFFKKHADIDLYS